MLILFYTSFFLAIELVKFINYAAVVLQCDGLFQILNSLTITSMYVNTRILTEYLEIQLLTECCKQSKKSFWTFKVFSLHCWYFSINQLLNQVIYFCEYYLHIDLDQCFNLFPPFSISFSWLLLRKKKSNILIDILLISQRLIIYIFSSCH